MYKLKTGLVLIDIREAKDIAAAGPGGFTIYEIELPMQKGDLVCEIGYYADRVELERWRAERQGSQAGNSQYES